MRVRRGEGNSGMKKGERKIKGGEREYTHVDTEKRDRGRLRVRRGKYRYREREIEGEEKRRGE